MHTHGVLGVAGGTVWASGMYRMYVYVWCVTYAWVWHGGMGRYVGWCQLTRCVRGEGGWFFCGLPCLLLLLLR